MATNLLFGGSIFQKNVFNNDSCINLPHFPLLNATNRTNQNSKINHLQKVGIAG